MPAKNLRLSVVVEPQLARWLRRRAQRQGISVSLMVRDLLHQVAEEEEERFWAEEGEKRLADFDPDEALPGEDAWG